MYICIYVYMYICIYVYMYLCTYLFIIASVLAGQGRLVQGRLCDPDEQLAVCGTRVREGGLGAFAGFRV